MIMQSRSPALRAAVFVLILLVSASTQAQVTYGSKPNGAPIAPRDKNSLLYYRIGGSESSQRAPNPGVLSVKLGLNGLARMNFSCGRFDMAITVQNLLNNLRRLGTQVVDAVKAGIAALPMYIFQRASPGLYELFQTYLSKAEKEWQIALKSCEEMEAQIRRGEDPYEDYVKIAKGESWKSEASNTQDAAQAKQNVETNSGTAGVIWIGGVKAGGGNQKPIRPVTESTIAGYNLQLNRPVLGYATTTTANAQNFRLTRAFPTAQEAANWAVSVIGDQELATCSDSGCPLPGATNGVGLLPKLEAEFATASTQVARLANGTGVPSVTDIDAAQAPGIAISRELVDALRALPLADRNVVAGRLAMEIAQARVLDKALLVRNAIMTAASGVPEIERSPAGPALRAKLADINRLIEDMLFDVKARREVVSQTAATLLETYRAGQAGSGAVLPAGRADPHPFANGRPQ
jgi:integrating conjugative element protein (TIGR03755 family)